MQKHQKASCLRWLLLMLTLLPAAGAHAVVEKKAPLNAVPGAPQIHNLSQSTGCSLIPPGSYGTNDYPSDLFYRVVEYCDPGNPGITIPRGSLTNNCVPREVPEALPACGYYRYSILIIQSAKCPDPITYPAIKYVYKLDSQMCERELPEAYKLALTPDQATIEPGMRNTFTATVTKQDGSAPSMDVSVNISLKVDATSGGHVHGDSTRPRGGIDNTKCESDATCKTITVPAGSTTVTFDFNATDAAGTHTVTASCDKCTNGAQSANVTVKVEGLELIPDSAFYAFIGGGLDKPHRDNHYLTRDAAVVLWNMAFSYLVDPQFKLRDPVTKILENPPILHINDASLVWGGIFDAVNANWEPPHHEHRRGTVVDLRANDAKGAIPARNFKEFDRYLRAEGDMDFIQECTKDKKGTPQSQRHNRIWPGCISKLDGSSDVNRHYHIRLKGAAE